MIFVVRTKTSVVAQKNCNLYFFNQIVSQILSFLNEIIQVDLENLFLRKYLAIQRKRCPKFKKVVQEFNFIFDFKTVH